MKVANRIFLRSAVAGWNTYTAKDTKYIIAAIPIVMNKFGLSGSLKNENNTLEHAMDVMTKINNEVFFELKYILPEYSKFNSGRDQKVVHWKSGRGRALAFESLNAELRSATRSK